MSTRCAKLHSDALTVMGKDPGRRSVPGIVDRPKDSPSDIRIATTSPSDVGDDTFRAIAEQSSDLMMIANRERVVRWANAAFERVLGYRPESLVGTNIFPLFHPDDVSVLDEMIRRVSEVPGMAGTVDVRMRAADGSWHWMETSRWNLLGDPIVRGCVVSFRDVTDQRVLEAALRASEARYADLFEHARDAVFIADLDARLLSVNLAVEQLTGYSRAELLEMNIFDLIAPEDQVRMRTDLGQRLAGGAHGVVEVQLLAKDGSRVFIETDVRVVTADDGSGLIEGIAHDTTERHILQDRLQHQVHHDALTELPNWTLFFDRLDHALARRERDRSQVAVMLLDIDDFKSVNDSRGHAAGNELLIEIARRLRSVVRAGETVARLGGDEFAVVVEDIGVRDEVVALSERVQSVFGEPFTLGETTQHITASLGIAVARAGNVINSGDLLRDADTAMYQAKARAKGGTEFFAPRLRWELLRRVALSTALETAVRDGELEVRYQPIVSITDGRILALEALVRWLRPMWGWVQPDEFIPLAEQNGMIVALGRYVLGAVAPQIAQWRRELPGSLPLGVFINASPQELSTPGFVPFAAETLHAHGLTNSDIAFELTERAFISRTNRTLIKNLAELTKIGVHIVLDDFGTGYSALASLQRFPLAALKIDRAFIDSIRTPDDQAPIASAIIALGKSLGMMVIAEGVEHQVQLDYLRRLGCDAAQGFLFARPQHANEVPTLISASARPHGGSFVWHPGATTVDVYGTPSAPSLAEMPD